jgi:hypothetical protein
VAQPATEPAAGGLPSEAAQLIGEEGVGPEGPRIVGEAEDLLVDALGLARVDPLPIGLGHDQGETAAVGCAERCGDVAGARGFLR